MVEREASLGSTAPEAAAHKPLLAVRDLSVSFGSASGRSEVVSRLSYDIDAGETLGVVGESGCGKTMTSLALLGLVPPGATSRATSSSPIAISQLYRRPSGAEFAGATWR